MPSRCWRCRSRTKTRRRRPARPGTSRSSSGSVNPVPRAHCALTAAWLSSPTPSDRPPRSAWPPCPGQLGRPATRVAGRQTPRGRAANPAAVGDILKPAAREGQEVSPAGRTGQMRCKSRSARLGSSSTRSWSMDRPVPRAKARSRGPTTDKTIKRARPPSGDQAARPGDFLVAGAGLARCGCVSVASPMVWQAVATTSPAPSSWEGVAISWLEQALHLRADRRAPRRRVVL